MSARTDIDELDDDDLVAARPAPTPELVRQVRVARQGLYDGRRQLAGYRVVFGVPESGGRPGAPVAVEPGGDQAGAAAIAAAFGTFRRAGRADGKPPFVRPPPAL